MTRSLRKLAKSGDEHFIEIIKHSIWAMVILCLGTVVQFFFDLSLTHTFKASGSGIFYLCFSVISALALLGRLGIDRAVVKFMPPLLADKPDEAAGIHKTSSRLSLAFTIPLAVLLFLLAGVISRDIFHSPELASYLRIFAFAVPPLALNYVYSGVLRALKQTRHALSIERLTMYALGIVAVLTLGRMYGLAAASIGFTAAIYISTIEGAWYIRRHLPTYQKALPFNKKVLIKVSIPLLFVVFAAQMIGQVSVILLGAMSSSANVSIFNIALRVSMLLNLILIAINTISATKISELYAAGKHKELQNIISKVSSLSFLLSAPVFVVLILFSHFWLGLFGSAFVAGSTVLAVLAAGQFINVITGSNNFVLAMTGHEKALAITVGVSLGLNVVLGLILIPPYSVVGAGLAASIATITSNLIMLILVKRYVGVWSLPFRFIKVWVSHVGKSPQKNTL